MEVPPHCYADLPPVLAYCGSRLIKDVFSGWWCVLYTGFAARVAAFILWDVYDRHQLWRLTPTMIKWIRCLDLRLALGLPMNEEELHFLLEMIESLDWSTGEVIDAPAAGRSSSSSAEQTEFIWFDPWRRRRIWQDEAFAMRKRINRQVMPDGHPTGFVDDPPLPPSAVRQFTWSPRHSNLIPSSHFYEEEGGDVVYAGPPVNKRGGMELGHPPAKQRRRGNELRDYPRGAGSSAVHAARGHGGSSSVIRPLGDDAIQRETGALVGRLNIPEADDLSAEIS